MVTNIVTNLVRVVTYCKELPSIKSHDPLLMLCLKFDFLFYD